MKPVRVLALITDAYGASGGIALYNRDFLQALSAHPRCSQIVTLPRAIPGQPGRVPEKVVHVTAAARGKLRYVATAVQTALHGPFGLIICGHMFMLPLAYVAHRLTRAPLILLTYGIEVWQPPRTPFARWALGRLSAYASISEVTQQKLLAWATNVKAKGSVLPNAIHLDAYRAGPKDPALAARLGVANKRVLMTLGRIVAADRYKGFDEVLEVLPDLIRTAPDLVYLIAGSGPDVGRLKTKAAALGVAEHVIFTGFVPEAEKAALYRLADVYVMPSRGEGFGFVILEALASGIPSIASSVDGGREALRNGMLGQLVDPSRPEEIKAAILKGLEMPKQVPEGLRYFAYEHFQERIHRAVDEWLAPYDDAAAPVNASGAGQVGR